MYTGGSEEFLKITRWLREKWDRFHTDPPPEWKNLPSTKGTTSRQQDGNSCGVYQLMFMRRIASCKVVEAVESGSTEAARGMIITVLWKGADPNEMYHRAHWSLPDGRTETGRDNETPEKKESKIHTESCWESP